MRYRVFGRMGWRVSEISFGSWGIGGMWGRRDDREAIRALQRAAELGISFFDTALAYGNGHSERLIARALGSRRRDVRIATKIPPKNFQWPARPGTPLEDAFPIDWMIRCTERSLRHLKTDAIDLQQLHVWNDRWTEREEWRSAVDRLRRDGKIRAFGVSINDHQPESALRLVRTGLVDAVQVIYNMFDQSPAKQLLPLCHRRKVAVIARVPFDEGSLTGTMTAQTRFPRGDWRQYYFTPWRIAETVERVQRLSWLLDDRTPTMAVAALKFCLAHPAVATVIPGMRRVAHVEANAAASDGRRLSAGHVRRLKAHAWPRNFYPFG